MDTDRSKKYLLARREVVKKLLNQRGDMLIVAGLGASAWDVTAAGDGPLNFPLWGAMTEYTIWQSIAPTIWFAAELHACGR